PLIVREGKEQLFEESYYGVVFPKSDPDYYLTRYWLGKHVTSEAWGYPERAYAKWLILHFMWKRLSSVLGTKALKRVFIEESENYLWGNVCKATTAAFKAAIAYFRANRGSGATRLDPSTFFKHSGHHEEFEIFWSKPKNKERKRFARVWEEFRS